jgi:hypothetical protein
MAYTQAEINAALAAELAANPMASQAGLIDVAKSAYGLTDAQINAAFDTIAGFNAQGQYDPADYIANRVAGTVDPQMVVDAANAARAKEYAANVAFSRANSVQHSVVNPTTGKLTQLNEYHPDFNPNDPFTLAMLGQKVLGGDSGASNFFLTNPQYRPLADAAWAAEKARLDAPASQQGLLTATGQTGQAQTQAGQAARTYTPAETAAYNAFKSGDIAAANNAIQSGKLTAAQIKNSFGFTDADIAYLANNSGIKFYTPTTVTTGVTGGTVGGTTGTNRYAAGAVVNANGSVTIGNKTYTPAEAALYNAYLDGNMAEFNRLTALNKFTLPDMQAKFGLSDADMAWITNNAGGQFYSPTGTKTGITNVINTIGGNQTQTAPVGQFRELFPSFAESQRLAGQMVANRPTTENIISMINSNSARPVTVGGVNYSAPESAAYNAYISGNIPEFNRLTQLNQLTAPAMQSKFSLSDADMAYITNNRGGVFYNPTGTQQAAPPSLNNVLSMISK